MSVLTQGKEAWTFNEEAKKINVFKMWCYRLKISWHSKITNGKVFETMNERPRQYRRYRRKAAFSEKKKKKDQ